MTYSLSFIGYKVQWSTDMVRWSLDYNSGLGFEIEFEKFEIRIGIQD